MTEQGKAMSEAEWGDASVPFLLIEYLFHDLLVSDRKLRLFACACSQRCKGYTGDEVFGHLLAQAEAFADGMSDSVRLAAAYEQCYRRGQELYQTRPLDHVVAACEAILTCCWRSDERSREFYSPSENDIPYPCVVSLRAATAAHYAQNKYDEEYRVQTALLRDIFGNPFRPAILDPSWLTSTVVALAGGIYESRDFSTMPILADALQDAGCDNAEILDHCRKPGPHVRGCFVVDLLLGKS